MKERINSFSVSTITEKLRNSQRLFPFLILAVGTFLPVVFFFAFLNAKISDTWFCDLLFFVYFSLGWVIRYFFIVGDMFAGNVKLKRFFISLAICLAFFVLFESFSPKPWFLESRQLNFVAALNIFPIIAFFSRKASVKEECLCLAIMLVTSLVAVLISDTLFMAIGLFLCGVG